MLYDSFYIKHPLKLSDSSILAIFSDSNSSNYFYMTISEISVTYGKFFIISDGITGLNN